jgi:uncharacterized protein (TIGR02271 family)
MSEPLYDNPATTANGPASATGGHRVACLFGTRTVAENAASELVSAGISRSAIQIVEQGPEVTSETTAGSGGLWERIKSLFTGEDDAHGYYESINRGQVLVTVPTANEAEAERVAMIMERHDPIDIDAQESGWREASWTPGQRADLAESGADMDDLAPKPPARATATGEPALAGRATMPPKPAEIPPQAGAVPSADMQTGSLPMEAGAGEEVIPVVEESLAVGKRSVARGGVRVRTYVVETPVEEDIRLREERVQIERRPVDRAALAGDEAFRERAVEMTETTEEPVVSKTARVTGEVGIRKETGERTEHISDKTRRTEVEIEDGRTSAATPARPA